MGLEPSPSCLHPLQLHGLVLGSECWRVLSSKGRAVEEKVAFLCLASRISSYLMVGTFWREPRSEFILEETREPGCWLLLGGESSLPLTQPSISSSCLPSLHGAGDIWYFVVLGFVLFCFVPRKYLPRMCKQSGIFGTPVELFVVLEFRKLLGMENNVAITV